jgi:hypothetical protein
MARPGGHLLATDVAGEVRRTVLGIAHAGQPVARVYATNSLPLPSAMPMRLTSKNSNKR